MVNEHMTDERQTVAEPDFEPMVEMVIEDLDTLKVLADPLRLNILEYLSKRSTVKRIAQKIDKPPTKLYYHFNLLEKHDLIKLVDTRVVSGIIEKHYQASARAYRVAPGLLTPGTEGAGEIFDLTIDSILSAARDDVSHSLRRGEIEYGDDAPDHKRFHFAQHRFSLSPELFKEFMARLNELTEEFDWRSEAANDDDPNATNYRMLFLIHPTAQSYSSESDAEND